MSAYSGNAVLRLPRTLFSMDKRPSFTEIQYAFTRHIRDPKNQPAPADVEDRRMGIYRELFYNNVESLLANSFPVLRKIMIDEVWHALIRDYFARHEAHTPLFPKMPQEFLQYLETERQMHPTDPPFLWELAHYEWVETALSLDTREIDLAGIDPEGDLLAGVPVLSPLAWPLTYRFPVQRLSPSYKPDEAPEEPTYLVIYRGRQDEVGFIELNPVAARLLERIAEERDKSGRELLDDIAKELQHRNPEVVIDGGLEIMAQLRAKDVLLGIRTT